AHVILITGPSALDAPTGPEVVRVETADQMAEAVRAALPRADVLIMAAAVADSKPVRLAERKIKRKEAPEALRLGPAPAALRVARAARAAGLVTVGLAVATREAVAHARGRLETEALGMIVVTDATVAGAGFEVESNRVVVLERDGAEEAVP